MLMAKKLAVDLLVAADLNRVVFAEAGGDFVDVLLSFLTLPLATVARLLGDRSKSVGSIRNLYSSVESLDSDCFCSPPCKAMLLRPRSAAWARCKGLAINLDDSDPEVFYRCRTWSDSSARTCLISSYPNCLCSCGQVMDTMITVFPESGYGGEDGVFVKGATRFMIGDDLNVRPVSIGESLVLFEKLGIRDGSDLQKITVVVGTDEVMRLLERSLVSKTPLTDVFLQEPDENDNAEKFGVQDLFQAGGAWEKPTGQSKVINLKLFLTNESNKVVYAEVGEDFVNLLFSFLTFPLGSVVKLLNKRSSMGSIDNLYESVKILSCDNYVKSEDCKNMLLAPKLPPYFGCSSQLLRIDEMPPQKHKIRFNGIPLDKMEMDPRLQNSGLECGSFVQSLVSFMVTDEMLVTTLSAISGIHIVNKMTVPISCLEEAEAILGETEALNLLRAWLISHRALSDVFSPSLLSLLEEKWSGQFPSESVVL